jgi:HAD superfamily hydrolase (TIGR01509 family)
MKGFDVVKRTIRSVAFDANGVIYYRNAEVSASVVDFIQAKGIELPTDAESMYVELMNEAFNGTMSREEMVEAITSRWGITDPAKRRLVASSIAAYSREIHLYPGVPETLKRLRELGIGTGVITNTFQSSQEKWAWFEQHNIAPYLDRMISSIEVGVAKPEPAIYTLYAEKCGLRPEEIAFVGHDLNELRGAQEAGMKGLAFRPDQPGTFEPEFYDFPDLVTLIQT